MNVSYRWLQDYVKTGLTPLELADKFRMTSSELEDMKEWGSQFDGLVIGKVLKVSDHPNADRLHLAEVKVGSGPVRHIVCGAPNLAIGQSVIVALPGVTLNPLKGEPFTIKEATIRGEHSEGMLCSAEEIGLPLSSDGILVLEGDIAPGTPAAQALGLEDTVLDLEITPNRPDLLSYVGLAREVCAFEKKRLLEPPLASGEEAPANEVRLSVEIEDAGACPRYTAACLSIPNIGQSPLWMQSRLILSGIRPLDAVVDITNYCMLEYGQPLHAFDLNNIKGRGIRVRNAHQNEAMQTLDGNRRSLHKGDIVIADNTDAPLAVAGIMGGAGSAVTAETTEIMLESANFHGPQIRRTSRRLGLRSEASTRFEKGLDPDLTITALKRAVYLLQELCGAKVISSIHDRYPGKISGGRPRIHLSFTRIQEITGVRISAPEAKGILQRLGFQITSLTKSSFEATPPSWRQDVKLPEDIVEELIRIWGFERLPSTMPTGAVQAPRSNIAFRKKSLARRVLASLGLHECVHLSFASETEFNRLGMDANQAVRLQNPLSSQMEYLITSHALPLLGNMGSSNVLEPELGLFEIGHVFTKPHQEKEMLSFVLRSGKDIEDLYRFAKTAINRLARQLNLPEPTYVAAEGLPFHEAALDVMIGNAKMGILGVVKGDVVANLKIRSGRNLIYAEFDADKLFNMPEKHFLYNPPRTYPSIERDLTLVIDKDCPIANLERVLDEKRSKLLAQWSITDIFTGKPLPSDKKSVTIHFAYNSPDRTLEDQEASEDQIRLSNVLRDKLMASIN